MATATSSRTSSTCPSVSIAVSSSSLNGGTQRYSYTVTYNTYGYKLSASSKPTVTAKIGSTTVYSSSITVGGKSSYTLKTGTLDVGRGTSTSTLSISISIAWGSIKWSGTTLGTRSGSSSIGLPAKTSYSVGYNANGGSGAPSNQTKWYGTTLTLSLTKPTRTGYTFSKWNTASDGSGTNYSSGASYTVNAGTTLYAQWTANTYNITLNSNGGTGGTSSVTKTYDQSVTLPSAANSPTRTSYKFLGWAESPSAQSPQYKAGSSYTKTITANTTLYAVWELMYLPPTISDLQCYRSDSSGNASDKDSYGCVKFNWKVDQTIGASNVMKLLTISADDVVKWSATPGGASGTVSQVISGLDTDATYTIKVVLKDTYANGTTITRFGYIDTAFFTIDVKAGGTGIAFGKAAEQNSRFDLAWNMVMDNGTGADGSGIIYGRDPSTGDEVAAFQPQNENGNTVIGHGNYSRSSGNTNIYGNNVSIIPRGTTNLSKSRLYLDNDYSVYGKRTNGDYDQLIGLSNANNTFIGYNGYTNSNGNTRIYGNNVQIISKNCDFTVGNNKVLWQGGYYMAASQTATLSEAVSKQANGIVLVFSGYNISSSEVQNTDFNCYFIPKFYVSRYSSYGLDFAVAKGSEVIRKYLYLFDTKIVGYTNNNVTTTFHGRSIDCRLVVLREVIGV